jgi:hypothetical protein
MNCTLTIAQASHFLGISPFMFRNNLPKYNLTTELTPGGHRRFNYEEIKKLKIKLNDIMTGSSKDSKNQNND